MVGPFGGARLPDGRTISTKRMTSVNCYRHARRIRVPSRGSAVSLVSWFTARIGRICCLKNRFSMAHDKPRLRLRHFGNKPLKDR